MQKKTWKEFRDSGLLWFVNGILHVFGYSIVLEVDKDGEITSVYPARVTHRGFSEQSTDEGYIKITEYLNENISQLKKEIE